MIHHFIDNNNELYATEDKDYYRMEFMVDDILKSVSHEYLRADFDCQFELVATCLWILDIHAAFCNCTKVYDCMLKNNKLACIVSASILLGTIDSIRYSSKVKSETVV